MPHLKYQTVHACSHVFYTAKIFLIGLFIIFFIDFDFKCTKKILQKKKKFTWEK